ncbi:MAG: hypothetical protein GY944_21980, partial [bacterium]|nr:hypothetical protein [bacterium]
MRRSRTLAAVAALAASLSAQNTLVIPKAANTVPTTKTNSTTDVPFYGHTNPVGTYGRFQYFYD